MSVLRLELSPVGPRRIMPTTTRRRLGAVLLLSLMPAGYVGVQGANGTNLVKSLLPDPLSIFSDRSPGARGIGQLAQSKLPSKHPEPAPGELYELGPDIAFLPSGGSTLPPVAPGAQPEGEMLPALGPTSLFTDAPSAAQFQPSAFLTPPFLQEDFRYEGASGTPSGGGSGSVPGLIVPTIPPQTTSVPEPEVWLMMLAGFLAIGSANRNMQRRKGETSGVKLTGSSPGMKC